MNCTIIVCIYYENADLMQFTSICFYFPAWSFCVSVDDGYNKKEATDFGQADNDFSFVNK